MTGAGQESRVSHGNQELTWLKQLEMMKSQSVVRDAHGDALGEFPDRVARGRLHPAATEQSADDRQPLAERERPRAEAVSQNRPRR